jgi:hypothetical protein
MWVVCLKCQHGLKAMDDFRAMPKNNPYFNCYSRYECMFCGSQMNFYYSRSKTPPPVEFPDNPKSPQREKGSLYGDKFYP